MRPIAPRTARTLHLLLSILLLCLGASAQPAVTNDPPFYGPFNAIFLPDGDGLEEKLNEHDSVLLADSPWSLYCWIQLAGDVEAPTLVAGLGDASEQYPRYIGLEPGKVVLWLGDHNRLEAAASLTSAAWHLLAATFDGSEFRLFSDGRELVSGKLVLGTVGAVLRIAPGLQPGASGKHFGGKVAGLTVLREALSPEGVNQRYKDPPDFNRLTFEDGSKPWRVQTRGQAGYRAPQDPATMPKSRALVPLPPSPFRPGQKLKSSQKLQLNTENQWTVGGWELVAAPEVQAEGSELSQTGIDTRKWIPATVPGTVLTSMVDRGIYPDPDYGLNNLAIPESLNKQDYWYRNEFKSPKNASGKRLTLTFQGINYKAAV